MTLTENLIRSAVLGTARQPFDPAADDNSVDLPATLAPEGQLLLSVVSTKLREWAGYMPENSHISKPDTAPAETTVECTARAMSYLRLILSGKYSGVLREWLTAAIYSGQHVRPDILPRLLLLGQKRADLRPYLLPVIGQRGQWLAYEISNQNWNWALETTYEPIHAVIDFERWQEAEILKVLRSHDPDRVELDIPEMMRYRMVWSAELTHVYLSAIRAMKTPGRYGEYLAANMGRGISRAACFFPLSMRSEIMTEIYEMPVLLPNVIHQVVANVKTILDFRQSMLNAIETREE